MAPTRYTQGHQLTEGPDGEGHALAARYSDSVVQGYGTRSYDDGNYHPSGYGEQGQQNTGSQRSGSQYSGSQYGSSQNTGSQNTGTYSGSQYGGSQNTNSQNTNSQSSESHSSGSYQQNYNVQNAGQQQSQQGASNSGYSHSGQGVPGKQQAYSDTANANGQQQSSWSQQNAQDPHSEASQQSPSNANHEQSSYSNNQAAESSHEQKNNAADLSSSHVPDKHQADKAQENNKHVASAETVQTAQQPTHTLPTITSVTTHPTFSLTTSAATTESTHTILPSTSSTSSATSSPTPAAAKDSDDGSFQKATGALAGLLGVALIAGFLIFWITRRKRQQKGEANRSRMVQDAFRQPYVDTKPRSSQFYTNFLGTAVGTGASALGAVRRSLAMSKSNHHHQKSEKEPMPEQGHIHHPCDDGIYVRGCDVEERSGHDSDRNDSIAAEKAAINESTPTLVVSPSETMARDQTPTVRRVISGRPQMESSESVEPKSGLSHNTQEGEAESSDKAQETNLSTHSPPPDNAAQENGPPPRKGNEQNLLAITSMVPSLSGIYRVEIAFQPKKVGQLDLREGQSIIIRQYFDDGWVSSFPPKLSSHRN